MADKKTDTTKKPSPAPTELKEGELDKVAGAGVLAGGDKIREK